MLPYLTLPYLMLTHLISSCFMLHVVQYKALVKLTITTVFTSIRFADFLLTRVVHAVSYCHGVIK